jgi:phosphoribosyl 1,2-cyclic phosphodiesterase
MSLELCILASGSSGNATVLRTPAGVMLIDAGIGPRTTAQRLAGTGVSVRDISAICLTHLDRDHFNPNWLATLVRQQARIFCHADRADEVRRAAPYDLAHALDALLHTFDASPIEPLPGVTFDPIPLAHDRTGSHGFLVEGFGQRLGYATDLGHVPAHLLDRLRDLDLLAIESNYDPAMQEASPRPVFLKRRITGGRGHLSNEQALAAVRLVLDRAQATGGRLPAHIVLLHRSRQCNCPDLVRRLFSRDRRIAPRLTLAEPYTRSEWLRRKSVAPATGEQLMLSFG